MSLDPLGGSLGNPQALNGYPYVANDPINATDPEGLKPFLAYQPENWDCTIMGMMAPCGLAKGVIIAGAGIDVSSLIDPIGGDTSLMRFDGAHGGWVPLAVTLSNGDMAVWTYVQLATDGTVVANNSDPSLSSFIIFGSVTGHWTYVDTGLMAGLTRLQLQVNPFPPLPPPSVSATPPPPAPVWTVSAPTPVAPDLPWQPDWLNFYQAFVFTEPALCGSGGEIEPLHIPETRMQQNGAAAWINNGKTRAGEQPASTFNANAVGIEGGNAAGGVAVLIGNFNNCLMAR
jgi:hypothetical protein